MNIAEKSIFPEKMLGFGLMRLPKAGEDIDIEETARMANEFLAKGFTYFDTAYVYNGSEEAFRKAVVERHDRDEFVVANKLPVWCMEKPEDAEKILDESLKRCGLEYFDYYLLHALGKGHLKNVEKFGAWDFVKRMKEEGKIRHIGFSFHDGPDVLEGILKEHPEVEFVQLQINYLDWDSTSVCAKENYDVCRKYNKEIIVMEPVKGGTLANLDDSLMEMLHKFKKDASAASYALRFVGSLDGVSMILSGMSTQAQMTDNLNTFGEFEKLSDDELEAVWNVREEVWKANLIPCTGCRYCCDGCPMGINIPEILKCMNEGQRSGGLKQAHAHYARLTAEEGSGKASECIGCGQCETACPQHIEVMKWLERAGKRFG